MTERAVVIGGGVQGVCVALALAAKGVRVTIVEAAEGLLDRASFRSEGKLHLGFVYANDPTGKTAALMLESALHFAPLLDRWVGPLDWDTLRSRPFTYATLPDSMLHADQLCEHYERIDRAYREHYRRPDLHYLGLRPETLLPTASDRVRAPDGEDWPATGGVLAATEERAVDRAGFRDRMRAAVAARSNIRVRYRHRVQEVTRTADGYRVSAVGPGGDRWESGSPGDQLLVDRPATARPSGRHRAVHGWVYRLKYRVLGRLPGRRTGRRSPSPSARTATW